MIYRTAAFLLLLPALAGADSFRQRGDEMLEASVMESDAVVDAVKSSLEGAQVVNVLYGQGRVGGELVAGSYVQIDAMPSLSEPTYESRDRDAALLYESLSEKFLEKNLVRMLLFKQRDFVGSLYRYGYAPPRQLNLSTVERRVLSPRIALGRQSLTWLSFFDRDENTRGGWTDAKWLTKAMVEDLAGVSPLEDRKPIELLQAEFFGPLNNMRHPIRYYTVGDELSTWKEVLDRAQRAIAIRVQFDQVRSFARPDQQLSFFLSMIKDERIYSSYALQELEKSGNPTLAPSLLALRPQLKFFADDLWETVLKITQDQRPEDLALKLKRYVELISSSSEAVCRDSAQFLALVNRAEKENGNILKNLRLGFVAREELSSSLSKLYETELRCYLVKKGRELNQLIPKQASQQATLELPDNRGLTLDELGLLSVVNKITPKVFRDRQQELEPFKATLFEEAWSSVVKSPSGLRAMLAYCADGLTNYVEVAFPDRTRGRYALWSQACRLLERFEAPQDYCAIPDSGILRDARDVQNLFAKAVLAAIAHEDEVLLTSSFAALTRDINLQKAKLVATLVRQSRGYSDKPIRWSFINSLERVPFFPVAEALAEEFADAGIKEAQSINKTMKQLTGYESDQQARSKGWIAYLTELSQRDKSLREKPLLSRDSLLNALSKPTCEEVDYGWNRMFRNLKLPPTPQTPTSPKSLSK